MITVPHSRTQQSLAGRVGAGMKWSRTDDRQEATRPAREAWARRFERQVDPHNELPEAERVIRAEHAKNAYMAQLSLRSAAARRRRAGGDA